MDPRNVQNWAEPAAPTAPPDDALGLLKRLNESIEQEPIEAPIPESDAILVMLAEGVYGGLQASATRKHKPRGLCELHGIARAAPLAG